MPHPVLPPLVVATVDAAASGDHTMTISGGRPLTRVEWDELSASIKKLIEHRSPPRPASDQPMMSQPAATFPAP